MINSSYNINNGNRKFLVETLITEHKDSKSFKKTLNELDNLRKALR